MRNRISTITAGRSASSNAVDAIWVATQGESQGPRFENHRYDDPDMDPVDVARMVAEFSETNPLVVERHDVTEVHPPGKWPAIILSKP